VLACGLQLLSLITSILFCSTARSYPWQDAGIYNASREMYVRGDGRICSHKTSLVLKQCWTAIITGERINSLAVLSSPSVVHLMWY